MMRYFKRNGGLIMVNHESRVWHWASHIILLALSLAGLIPFVLLFMSSITDELTILSSGYSFFPEKLSLSAYQYLWNNAETIARAYGVTIIVTVVGTAISVSMIAMLAYPLSRTDYPLRKIFAFLVFFTMLFNGGLVPTYLMYTQVFEIKNTLAALIVPMLLMNGFLVFITRTFYMTTIPTAILESARIDGAGEIKTFFTIVLPLSTPIMVTVGMLQTIQYWNDWFNGMIYLTNPKWFSLQNILNQIITNIQFLASSDFGSANVGAAGALPSETVRMAIAVVGVLPLIIAYPFFQKYFVKGLTVGSVKG
jgi:putative aldouronate transport system permease protein